MLTVWISGRGDRDGRAYSSLDGSVDGEVSSVDDQDEGWTPLDLVFQMFWSSLLSPVSWL